MQNDYISLNKEKTRNIIRKRWTEYTSMQLKSMSLKIMNSIEKSEHFHDATNVIMFYSLKDEPNTHSFIKKWCNKKNIYLPIVEGDNMLIGKYVDEDRLSKGAFGIMEPSINNSDTVQLRKKNDFIPNQSSSLIIVPGVAFTLDGVRLGRGRGYYDRFFLQKKLKHIYKIGICFPYQIVDALPFDKHDVFMDEVIYQ